MLRKDVGDYMNLTDFPRVTTALITPFIGDNLDLAGFRSNIQYQIEGGAEALLALGTTGEAPTMTLKEKEALLETLADTIEGKVPFIVNTGCFCTKSTCQRTLWAKQIGASSALVLAPYYSCPNQEGVYRHFAAICESTDLPILIYHHPKRTGVTITLDTFIRLSHLPNIIGVKECTPVAQMDGLIDIAQRANWVVLAGDDRAIVPAMSIGAHGVVSVLSNAFPREIMELVRAMQSGQIALAREIHRRLYSLLSFMEKDTNPIPIKAVMQMQSLFAGDPRLPLTPLSRQSALQLEELLKGMEKVYD